MGTDDYLMISGLQHLLFCERQAALIHLEQQWAENELTVLGQQVHREVDTVGLALRAGVRLVRGMPLVSHELRLSGRADLVALEPGGTVVPIEYKHGKRGNRLHNKVQLCAQAIALEEMMEVHIPVGVLYFHRSRRRMDIELDADLRNRTRQAAGRFHRIMTSAQTPPARYEAKCHACSLIDLCLPRICDPRFHQEA